MGPVGGIGLVCTVWIGSFPRPDINFLPQDKGFLKLQIRLDDGYYWF